MNDSLFEKLNNLWESEKPFVCFRLPNTDKASVFFQKDTKLHWTKDLSCSGFLMAPFDLKQPIPFIPDQFSEQFKIINTSPNLNSEVILDSKNKISFESLVIKAKEVIASGRLKKVVLSHSQDVKTKRDAIAIFQDLLSHYSLAMVYLWHHPLVGTWFGATPEQFITTQENLSQTMALAGTQTYLENKDPNWTTKEIEEQELVAIQVEEDLKKIFPTNQIQKNPTIDQRAGNLVHLCTCFQFPKLDGNIVALAQVLHPTPAVGGVPKEEAIRFIEENEAYERSFYTGFLGPTNSSESQLYVNLRCARWTPETTTLFVGAGITLGSDPEKEWLETQRKAYTLAKVL